MVAVERSPESEALGYHPGEALNARQRRDALDRDMHRFQLKGWLSEKETDKMRALKVGRSRRCGRDAGEIAAEIAWRCGGGADEIAPS